MVIGPASRLPNCCPLPSSSNDSRGGRLLGSPNFALIASPPSPNTQLHRSLHPSAMAEFRKFRIELDTGSSLYQHKHLADPPGFDPNLAREQVGPALRGLAGAGCPWRRPGRRGGRVGGRGGAQRSEPLLACTQLTSSVLSHRACRATALLRRASSRASASKLSRRCVVRAVPVHVDGLLLPATGWDSYGRSHVGGPAYAQESASWRQGLPVAAPRFQRQRPLASARQRKHSGLGGRPAALRPPAQSPAACEHPPRRRPAPQQALFGKATAPFKNVLMLAFMMWMSGTQLHLFSIMTTISGLYQPLTAIIKSGEGGCCRVFSVLGG